MLVTKIVKRKLLTRNTKLKLKEGFNAGERKPQEISKSNKRKYRRQ